MPSNVLWYMSRILYTYVWLLIGCLKPEMFNVYMMCPSVSITVTLYELHGGEEADTRPGLKLQSHYSVCMSADLVSACKITLLFVFSCARLQVFIWSGPPGAAMWGPSSDYNDKALKHNHQQQHSTRGKPTL